MVRLDRIYTRGGDAGETSLVGGERRRKDDARVGAYGDIDETNAAIGVARAALPSEDQALDPMLERIQNELFDLGAELATPAAKGAASARLAVTQEQVARLEAEIDEMNGALAPLKSFVLPGGAPVAAHLHLARAISRRAERAMVALAALPGEEVAAVALSYVNRLSDFLFVASRWVNRRQGDVLWRPGATRSSSSTPR
ncbi:cob(I)yrinic acid a,c-diamide adenosyltransferase [Methylocystis bryophila]|uniref:Corrinoid adenosyltransferase n=1 Tax=Methylocystis bryophila TaxID=655015 RepID=A0A1W6MSP2_9HYPH|nr:cob(I)yrinic acid a,c-diamide adenosyltransferase [Methylocystis bryophila]ARN80631.1 ATP:cob(I)alamin adenosyltransferase [Methylocystis bryophila]BDV40691.1 cob(I)yrinic acid a,c-diamide adenosyltransferase [Methylocystis bryophila]